MTQLTRTAATVLAVVVAVLSGASAWMLSGHSVSSGSMSQIQDVVVWSLAAVAALSALVAVVPSVRRGIGTSVGASITAASVFVLAMTVNAVARDASLAAPGQRSLSLLAVILSVVGATLTALSLSSAPQGSREASRREPRRL